MFYRGPPACPPFLHAPCVPRNNIWGGGVWAVFWAMPHGGGGHSTILCTDSMRDLKFLRGVEDPIRGHNYFNFPLA